MLPQQGAIARNICHDFPVNVPICGARGSLPPSLCIIFFKFQVFMGSSITKVSTCPAQEGPSLPGCGGGPCRKSRTRPMWISGRSGKLCFTQFENTSEMGKNWVLFLVVQPWHTLLVDWQHGTNVTKNFISVCHQFDVVRSLRMLFWKVGLSKGSETLEK